MHALSDLSIPVIVHVILGLPGETPEDMYETIRYLNRFHPFGIKLQLLHILKGTVMAEQYGLSAPISDCACDIEAITSAVNMPSLHILAIQEYIDIVIHCLEILDPDVVVHRVTGDGPKDLTLAPLWSLNKRNVLNTLHKTLRERQTYQGRLYL